MAGPGFEEAQSDYRMGPSSSFVGDVRRFGPHGPAYEVLAATDRDVDIVVIESGERLRYPLIDMLADPIAETVP